MPKPDSTELQLAEQIQKNLLNMTKQLRPKDVVPEDAVRTLLGIPKTKEEKDVATTAAPTATMTTAPPTPVVVNLEPAPVTPAASMPLM